MKSSRLIVFCLSVIAVFVIGLVLFQLRTVLLPLILAGFLSYIFRPLYLWLKDHRVPTAFALIAVLLAVSLVFVFIGLIVASSADSFQSALPLYTAKVNRIVVDMGMKIEVFAQSRGIDTSEFFDVGNLQLSSFTSAMQSGLSGFFSLFSNTFLILLYMMFILAGSGQLEKKIPIAFSSNQTERLGTLIHNMDVQIKQYLLQKTLISLGTGILTTIILSILGVDFAILWGFLAFLLNFIPNIGSLIAMLFPLLLSFLQFDSLVIPLLVLILLGGVQLTMGNVVEPRLMAAGLNISPLLVLVSLIFWGWLWGIWGMVLAIPLTATLKIIFENIESLRPVAILMSDSVPDSEPVLVAGPAEVLGEKKLEDDMGKDETQ